MAVYNPDQLNLAPAYANIISALKNQTEIAANEPPSTLALLARVAGQAGGAYVGQKIGNKLDVEKQTQLSDVELAKQKDLSIFQNKLQQDLDLNKEKYKLEGEGKILLDDAGIQQYFQQQGIDPKFAPKVPSGSKIWLDPKQISSKVKHAEFLTEVEKAAEKYLGSKDPDDQKTGQFLKIIAAMPEEKMTTIADDIRKAIMPEKDSLTRGSSMLSHERRRDELYKQFRTDTDKINFQKYADAKNTADRSARIEKHTGPSDSKLLYAFAKMLQPTGVLTDQDFRTGVNTGSYKNEIIKGINKLDQGQVLDDEFRNQIISEISNRYDFADEQLKGIEDYYQRRGALEGIPSSEFVRDLRNKKKDEEKSGNTVKTVTQNGKEYKIEVDKDGKFVREVK